ncbi:MAG: nucleotidyltransferase domain-containing protein [Candidatus Bathycorpusculaceae bacterium]
MALGFSSYEKIRRKVAREAAALLYLGVEKEYKQAKLRAAETLGVHFLPTNLEVAMELDKIAEENEGNTRQERLIQMRLEALKLMKILKNYNPILVGSVWRGTIYRDSDIDITLYHNEPKDILKLLKRKKLKMIEKGWVTITKEGKMEKSFHILLELPTKEKAEITVRSMAEYGTKERCEIYGDVVSGLNLKELEAVLSKNPTQRFVPF